MRQIKLGDGSSVYEIASEGYQFTVFEDFKRKDAAYGGDTLDTSQSGSTLLSTTTPVPVQITDKKVIPEGLNNTIPQYLRDMLDNNHLGGSVLDKMIGLILAQGIGQYTEEVDAVNNLIVRKWQQDSEITKWLQLWDYKTYIINTLEDYVKGGSVYSKLLRNVGGRIQGAGNAKINEIQHVCAPDCRREWPDNKGLIKNILVGDWTNTGLAKEVFPVWTRATLTMKATMMAYRTLYRFGRGSLQPILPPYWGVRSWMTRSTDIPDILSSLSDNVLSIKWHIISPNSYWEGVEEKLKARAIQEGKVWKDEILESYKESFLTSLSTVLAGKKNTGKFIHTQAKRIDLEMGKSDLDKWEFIALDMKMDKFIESQIKISERADVAIASGMGLAPSLSNIVADGRQGSGSESLYSYKLFRTSAVQKVEYAVFGILNDAIWFNWPTKNIQMGFYSESVMKEQNVTPSDRMVNAIN